MHTQVHMHIRPGHLEVTAAPIQRSRCALVFLSPDFLVERDNDFCVCETPCNMTRYSKELSFVKIPSKASAKYLAKKYNKSEQYIKWVSLFCAALCEQCTSLRWMIISLAIFFYISLPVWPIKYNKIQKKSFFKIFYLVLFYQEC